MRNLEAEGRARMIDIAGRHYAVSVRGPAELITPGGPHYLAMLVGAELLQGMSATYVEADKAIGKAAPPKSFYCHPLEGRPRAVPPPERLMKHY